MKNIQTQLQKEDYSKYTKVSKPEEQSFISGSRILISFTVCRICLKSVSMKWVD